MISHSENKIQTFADDFPKFPDIKLQPLTQALANVSFLLYQHMSINFHYSIHLKLIDECERLQITFS